jgi:hypothetical protein
MALSNRHAVARRMQGNCIGELLSSALGVSLPFASGEIFVRLAASMAVMG